MINSSEFWDRTQHEVITIALANSINLIRQCQEWFQKWKKKKTCSWGQKADKSWWFITNVHFWDNRRTYTSMFVRNIVVTWLFQGKLKMVTGLAFLHKHACTGVSHIKYTHLVSTQSSTRMLRTTCAEQQWRKCLILEWSCTTWKKTLHYTLHKLNDTVKWTSIFMHIFIWTSCG